MAEPVWVVAGGDEELPCRRATEAMARLAAVSGVVAVRGRHPVEAVRQLRIARSGAMKARTAAANQLHSLRDTAPDAIRARSSPLLLVRVVGGTHRPGGRTGQ